MNKEIFYLIQVFHKGELAHQSGLFSDYDLAVKKLRDLSDLYGKDCYYRICDLVIVS